MIWCYCESCKHNDGDGACELDSVTLSDMLTAAGFLPVCQEYEEDGGD